MALTHTPGPWGYTYDGSGDYSIGPAEDPQLDRVAVVSEREPGHRDWQKASANARLIAAAPDLLAAAKLAKANWGLEALIACEHAIAKAEEQS